MTEDLRNIVLGVLAAGLSATIGWAARSFVWRRKLRRMQAFFGLGDGSEALLVVNRDAGVDGAVSRPDVFALLELASMVKDCGALVQVVRHDQVEQGFGDRTEFCVGGPVSNRRVGQHLQALLPGVSIPGGTADALEQQPDRGYRIGSETYRMEKGVGEYVLLARLTTGRSDLERPAFVFCGQRAVTNQAATRYLVRNHARLHRKYGKTPFVLLLRVVNSEAYGPDVVELVADVTRAARQPLPPVTREPEPAA